MEEGRRDEGNRERKKLKLKVGGVFVAAAKKGVGGRNVTLYRRLKLGLMAQLVN